MASLITYMLKSASLITSANAMPTKEKVASREKSRLVENGLYELSAGTN